METNLKAIGLVLKENIAKIYARLDELSDKQGAENSVLEAAFFKRLDGTDAAADFLSAEIATLKTLIALYPDSIDADIARSIEVVRGELLDAIAERPGVPGEKGERGEPGVYTGLDSVQKFTPGNKCNDRELYAHEGGLWKCTGQTYSAPDIENDRWVLIANGVSETTTNKTADRAELVIKLANGETQTLAIDIPAPNYTNQVWEKDADYALRDVVWKDGHSFISLNDSPEGQPGESKEWAKYTMRGRAGRRGEKGEPGQAGKPGITGTDGRDGPSEQKIKSFINHILEADDSDTPIRRSRGRWVLADGYGVGDVVSMGSGLYLCVKAHEGKAPASDHQAGDYWRVLVPAAGVGVGGSGSGGPGLPVDGNDVTVTINGHTSTLTSGLQAMFTNTMANKGAVSTLDDIAETGIYEGVDVALSPVQGAIMIMAGKDESGGMGVMIIDAKNELHVGSKPSGGSFTFSAVHHKLVSTGDIQVEVSGAFTTVLTNTFTNILATVDLMDGAEHVVRFVMKPGSPDIVSTADWGWMNPKQVDATGTPVRMELSALGGTPNSTLKLWVEDGALVTIKKKDSADAASAFVVTHVELQGGHAHLTANGLMSDGSADALSIPFVSLNSIQEAAVKNNAFWMDETQVLHWRDNTGTDKVVALTP